MSRVRNWINRDDGYQFQVGNRRLFWPDIAGILLLVLWILSIQLNHREPGLVPFWIQVLLLTLGFCLTYIGVRRHRKDPSPDA